MYLCDAPKVLAAGGVPPPSDVQPVAVARRAEGGAPEPAIYAEPEASAAFPPLAAIADGVPETPGRGAGPSGQGPARPPDGAGCGDGASAAPAGGCAQGAGAAPEGDAARAPERLRALLVLDWDDSLFPTSWLERASRPRRRDCEEDADLPKGPDDVRRLLAELAEEVEALLSEASSCGAVVVVTLAARPWVKESVDTYMPKAAGITSGVDVCYAREVSTEKPPSGTDPWIAKKRKAMEVTFDEALGRHAAGTRCGSLISIGDSDVERQAAQALGRDLTALGRLDHTKTVKLTPGLGPRQLAGQARALRELLREVVDHPGDMHYGPGLFLPQGCPEAAPA